MWETTADRQDTEDVRADYITLRVLARKACSFVEEALSVQRQIDHPGFPYFHFMASVFLMAQLYYLEDILVLAPRRTVELIGRTMVEGFLKLTWTEQDPGPRANRWFVFYWVQEWKSLTRLSARGEHLDDVRPVILDKLKTDASLHLTSEGKAALDAGVDLTPFGHFKADWTGKSPFELAVLTGLRNLYARFYDPNNDWLHWSPKGFLKSSDPSASGIEFTFTSYYQSVATLVGGIASILGCAAIWDGAHGADCADRIVSLQHEFRPWSPLPVALSRRA